MQAKVGDWSYLLTLMNKRMAVSADDVKRVMAEYFIPDNRTVAYLVKPETPREGEQAMKLQSIKPQHERVK